MGVLSTLGTPPVHGFHLQFVEKGVSCFENPRIYNIHTYIYIGTVVLGTYVPLGPGGRVTNYGINGLAGGAMGRVVLTDLRLKGKIAGGLNERAAGFGGSSDFAAKAVRKSGDSWPRGLAV